MLPIVGINAACVEAIGEAAGRNMGLVLLFDCLLCLMVVGVEHLHQFLAQCMVGERVLPGDQLTVHDHVGRPCLGVVQLAAGTFHRAGRAVF